MNACGNSVSLGSILRMFHYGKHNEQDVITAFGGACRHPADDVGAWLAFRHSAAI